MSRIDTHAFGLWWKLAKGWFSTKFSAIQVDLSPIEEDIADVKSDVADVKEAVENIDTSDLAKEEHLQWLNQFWGIAGAYTAEAKGGETTDNPVIDECKIRFAETFSGLIPSGFTMPNSVTIGTTTYTGTTT